MIIQIERSGGIIAIPIKKIINTESLPDNEKQEIQLVISQSDFFNLKSPDQSTKVRDEFIFKITVDNENSSHTLKYAETSLPPILNKLIKLLEGEKI